MARLLSESNKASGVGTGSSALAVGGVLYRNSAAKFWSGLFDEIVEDFPGCNELEMEALTSGLLTPEHLSPEEMLQRDLGDLEEDRIDEMVQDVVAELELLGPPPAVTARVFADGSEVLSRQLSYEAIDAELMPFLIVWPLEWARLAEFCWNAASIGGKFEASDDDRGYEYQVRFELSNEHLSEGLFRRKVRLFFDRRAVGSHAR